MFAITENKIREKQLGDDRAGAVVIFEGLVRNHNDGKKVTCLEYQAYIEMAEKVGQEILNETFNKFDIIDAACIHRVGMLQIGDAAVWIKVLSAHRDEAYQASKYIIDEVKSRVPIWKKEHYVDQEPEWVACHRCASHEEHHHSHEAVT